MLTVTPRVARNGNKLMSKKSGKDLEEVADQKEQLTIIQCIHSGTGTSKESKALGGHLG